jgi:hypothetical protein
MPFETPVIPAKAGIQFFDSAFPEVWQAGVAQTSAFKV